MILQELRSYGNPKAKLSRMVANGEYIPIVRGLYETDRQTSGYLLAGSIYGPSYLSFDFALAYHGLIPEAVYVFTSATYDKKKKKHYQTPFGIFSYRDVPKAAYPFGITLAQEGNYTFQIASPEKALCDKLYELPPVSGRKELLHLLTEELRIETGQLGHLNLNDIQSLQDKYHAANIDFLVKALHKM